MSERPYSRSLLFATYQNAELAREAISLARVFADTDFLRAADPEGKILRDWSRFVAMNDRLRHTLDGVLLAYAVSPRQDGTPREWAEAGRLAGRVEAFVLPSTAVECQVVEQESDGGEPAYLIALSGFCGEVMANVSWALPTVLQHYARLREKLAQEHLRELIEVHGLGSRAMEESDYIQGKRAVNEFDACVESYVRTWTTKGAVAPKSFLPRAGSLPLSERGRVGETYAACTAFLLSHELQHIEGGHFLSADSVAAFPPFMADLPEDVLREVEADCAAFTLTMNTAIVREFSDEDRPHVPDFAALARDLPSGRPSLLSGKRRRQQRALDEVTRLRACISRAVGAMLCFYAVTDLFAVMARQHGDEAQSARFERVAERKDVVRRYATWLLDGLEQDWGMRIWHPEEAALWTGLDQHVEHLKQTVVPTAKPGRAPGTLPPWAVNPEHRP
ncbi:hypothetical protein [Streptomyces sp. NPDC058653]|uniref:hypothetical protein n=1 Tax=Streptomyces sp. NPDC058653 TaxID=3346576 RepID=UPI0036604066